MKSIDLNEFTTPVPLPFFWQLQRDGFLALQFFSKIARLSSATACFKSKG